jgi:hypothetical protein
MLFLSIREQVVSIGSKATAEWDATTDAFLFATKMCHGCFGSLGNQVTFKLRQDRQHAKYHLARGARRIYPFA